MAKWGEIFKWERIGVTAVITPASPISHFMEIKNLSIIINAVEQR